MTRRWSLLASLGLGLALIGGLLFRIDQARAKSAELRAEVQQRVTQQRATLEQGPLPTAAALGAGTALRGTGKAAGGEVVNAEVLFSGELRPLNEAELAFKTGGRLARILVQPGDWVKEGQALLVLEDREAQAQLKQAKAGLEAARAQASIAEDAAKRVGQLGEKGAVSEQQKLQSADQARLAGASVASAEAVAELAELNLANHTLRAPFAGRITRTPSGVGIMVAPGIAVMGIVDSAHWKVLASASVDDGVRLHAGQLVRFNSPALREGRVIFVSPVLQDRSRRVQFQVTALADDVGALFGGQLISGSVNVGKR